MNYILCSSEDEEDAFERPVRVRRLYRLNGRTTVEDFDDVDFRRYFRLTKAAFWRVHGLVGDALQGDLRRYVR